MISTSVFSELKMASKAPKQEKSGLVHGPEYSTGYCRQTTAGECDGSGNAIVVLQKFLIANEPPTLF